MASTDGVQFEEAIAKTGGLGWYQTKLLIFTIPIGMSFSFGVTSVAYIMPAIICEFSISKYQQGLIYSAIYLGMVPFGAFWGGTADMLGRRITLILTTAIVGTFEFLSAFATSYWMLFACKVLSGCAASGIHLTYYIYLSEFIDVRYKDTMTVMTGGAAAFGYCLLPLIGSVLLPLKFKYDLIPGYVKFSSWNIFFIVSALAPLLGFIISVFILTETPRYLLVQNREEESLRILREIYSSNTKQPMDTFSVKSLSIKDELDLKKDESPEVGRLTKLVNYIKPLFKYPYLIPAMMSFMAQFITMAAYNTVRQHIPTLFALALGFGQKKLQVDSGIVLDSSNTSGSSNTSDSSITTGSSNASAALTNLENVHFCVLFESQQIFASTVDCKQEDVEIDYRIFLSSAFVGLMIFISFFFFKIAVAKIGKVATFVIAHVISAAAVAYFPYSNAYSAVAIMTVYSICMQNCLTLVIGFMIGRVPASLRGITVSLIMVIGRIGVILGNQVLPVITNISCYIGFWFIACINLMAVPIMFVYSRQPNPYEDAAIVASKTNK